MSEKQKQKSIWSKDWKPSRETKKILGILFIFLCLAAYGSLFEFGGHRGSQSGTIAAVEHNSNIIWPATLVYVKTGLKSKNESIYCVNDETIKNQLIKFTEKRELITVYYYNEPTMWKWDCNDGKSIIYKIEACNNVTSPCQEGVSEIRGR